MVGCLLSYLARKTPFNGLWLYALQISYNGVLGACGNAGEWKEALRLLEDMRQAGVTPNAYNYSAASERGEEITGRPTGRADNQTNAGGRKKPISALPES